MSEAEVLEPTNAIATVEPGTNIVEAVAKQPGIVLLDREKFSAWYEKLKSEAPTDVDVSTAKGRDALRSFAARVRSEKAAIDKERLRLTADWRDMVKQANDAGNEIREQLDALANEVRAPLTAWEEAEKEREAEVERIIGLFRSSRFVPMGEAADSIRERGTAVHEIAIDPDLFRDRKDEAEREKKETVEHLFAALKAAEKAEADRAELERLQREAAEREEAERVKREADEAEARRIEEEKRAEQAKADAEAAEQRRIEAAAEQAKRDAEAKADEERKASERKREYARQIIDHIKQVGLGMIGGKPQPYGILLRELEMKIEINDDLGDLQDEVRAIRDATHAQLTASMERAAAKREQEEQEEERRRQDEAKAKREADQAHRTAVKTKAKEAIISCGADEETAKKIVMAIIAGEIPAVRMEF